MRLLLRAFDAAEALDLVESLVDQLVRVREHEHAAFLRWLLDTCAQEQPDVLVVTGDVFDTATPPASAERMWFELLATARRRHPAMDIIAIAGNHSASLDVVAPGIAEALIATAIGLVAAIPAVMAYNYFLRRIRVLESGVESFGYDFLNIVRRHFLRG